MNENEVVTIDNSAEIQSVDREEENGGLNGGIIAAGIAGVLAIAGGIGAWLFFSGKSKEKDFTIKKPTEKSAEELKREVAPLLAYIKELEAAESEAKSEKVSGEVVNNEDMGA